MGEGGISGPVIMKEKKRKKKGNRLIWETGKGTLYVMRRGEQETHGCDLEPRTRMGVGGTMVCKGPVLSLRKKGRRPSKGG